MTFSVWFEGIDQLNRVTADLTKSALTAQLRASKVVRSSAAAIENTAKQFVPVDTGALRNSIGTDLTLSGLKADIATDIDYAGFVEWGTARQAPAGYLGPALDRHSAEFMENLGLAVDPLP